MCIYDQRLNECLIQSYAHTTKRVFIKDHLLVYNASTEITLIADRKDDLCYTIESSKCCSVLKCHYRLDYLNAANITKLVKDD